MPTELGMKLHRFYIHNDTVSANLRKYGIAPKYLRKWFYNFLIINNVPESVADFIEGRAPESVGSMHYLSRVKQADYWYEKTALPRLQDFFDAQLKSYFLPK